LYLIIQCHVLLGDKSLAAANGIQWANYTEKKANFNDNGKWVVCKVTHPAIDFSLLTKKQLHIFCEKQILIVILVFYSFCFNSQTSHG